MAKPNLILLGAPGSGKGTQAAKISSRLGYSHVSTGDLLRSEIAKGSELGKKVESILKEGALVDDHTVLDLLKANCDLAANAYIFDGFPRNLDQAQLLDEHIIKDSASMAIFFEIDDEVIVERIVNRRIAKGSGEIYNLKSRPPKVEGKCDVSGEDLIHRPDDQEDVVRKRLEVFRAEIAPMLEYYEGKGRLQRVNALTEAEQLFSEIEKLIG
ncbi:MAG: adenylate kinase [Bacteriovoracaceae bacterium]